MKTQEYIDQSADALNLIITHGKIDSSMLNIVSSKMFNSSIGKFNLNIIGASHFIQFHHNDTIFSEIFACINPNIKNQEFYDKNKLERGIIRNVKDLSYTFKKEVKDWPNTKDRFNDLVDKVNYLNLSRYKTNACGFMYEFTNKATDAFKPLTLIHIENVNNGVCINTIHAYPNELKVIYTTSTFTLT